MFDRSLVQDIGSTNGTGIHGRWRSYRHWASLGKRVVDEGVENQVHLECLKALNCSEGHEFFFNRLLTVEPFTRLPPASGIEYDQPPGYSNEY